MPWKLLLPNFCPDSLITFCLKRFTKHLARTITLQLHIGQQLQWQWSRSVIWRESERRLVEWFLMHLFLTCTLLHSNLIISSRVLVWNKRNKWSLSRFWTEEQGNVLSVCIYEIICDIHVLVARNCSKKIAKQTRASQPVSCESVVTLATEVSNCVCTCGIWTAIIGVSCTLVNILKKAKTWRQ
jgi:hypothetical protein